MREACESFTCVTHSRCSLNIYLKNVFCISVICCACFYKCVLKQTQWTRCLGVGASGEGKGLRVSPVDGRDTPSGGSVARKPPASAGDVGKTPGKETAAHSNSVAWENRRGA